MNLNSVPIRNQEVNLFYCEKWPKSTVDQQPKNLRITIHRQKSWRWNCFGSIGGNAGVISRVVWIGFVDDQDRRVVIYFGHTDVSGSLQPLTIFLPVNFYRKVSFLHETSHLSSYAKSSVLGEGQGTKSRWYCKNEKEGGLSNN